ncbi:MAG: hypothetical protein GTO02_05210 [Candidatus Dadabacteria bacterium]|nr:hypothetical protein [Candidatus Dadabacteria bacterium]
MIGVISKKSQRSSVEEFFQLFKVPWEFYSGGRTYDVIISTDSTIPVPDARLTIVFGAETTAFDLENEIVVHPHPGGVLLKNGKRQFPIYGNFAVLQCSGNPFIESTVEPKIMGVFFNRAEQRIIRIGYDLFDEIAFLLSQGQKVEHAQIPAVELHISMLRNWILESGLPLIEIPNNPDGYNFIVCLTHDVDFIGIRNHKCDRSTIGFILRALFPFIFPGFRSRLSISRYLKNILALLLLPGVYLGLFRDFWDQIGRYVGIEKGIRSTFFFIPLKDEPGDSLNNDRFHQYRAARYDVKDYSGHIETLLEKGHEIGIHGLDAWNNSRKGSDELQVIQDITGIDELGIRMHWLYFSENAPMALGEAGFYYDSSLGFNETVGYRSGTTQVFRFLGSSGIFELPLHIQDTTMFYPNRMALSEHEAFKLCRQIIDDVRTYGGVFTINWHQRSLGPERNWDDFYIRLLRKLKRENVWFATGKQAVNWFRKRRSIHFKELRVSRNKINCKLSSGISNNLPAVILRVHYPRSDPERNEKLEFYGQMHKDITIPSEPEIEFNIDLATSSYTINT